jgi:hypothetical protein
MAVPSVANIRCGNLQLRSMATMNISDYEFYALLAALRLEYGAVMGDCTTAQICPDQMLIYLSELKALNATNSDGSLLPASVHKQLLANLSPR